VIVKQFPRRPVKSVSRKKAYASAGVDLDLGNRLKRHLQLLVKQTHGPQVLGKVGGFGGLFRANFSGLREPIW
jgi:phosphoribosylformylglycinamidine cyclo-ligase